MKILKLTISLAIIIFAFSSCKKEVSNLKSSEFLEVQEKNMGVVAKRTATWCGPCGDWGFSSFEDFKAQYKDEAVYMAFKTAFTSKGDTYYDKVTSLFGIPAVTPVFFYNFDTINGTNFQGLGSVSEHNHAEVIANSNYEYTLTEDKIQLNTTTKFFKSVEGDYVISPFLILDNQVGPQLGHPDTPNTVHPSFVANLAHPKDITTQESWAYKVASGKIEEGHQINLEFEVDRDIEWTEDDISFALILFKRVGSKYKFINAFTK